MSQAQEESWARFHVEVEHGSDARYSWGVTGKVREVKDIYHEAKYRAEIMRVVIDEARSGVGRYDAGWNSGPKGDTVHDRRRYMIVKSVKIIPGHDDSGGFPEPAVHDGVYLAH